MRNAMHHATLLEQVRAHYKKHHRSFETIESIFLAFKTIVIRNKQSPRPIDQFFLDFFDKDTGFGLYWNSDETRNENVIELIIWNGSGGTLTREIEKTVQLDSDYTSDLFECAVHLQDKYPNILKSMNLENILFSILKQDNIAQVAFAEHFSFQTSRYAPLS